MQRHDRMARTVRGSRDLIGVQAHEEVVALGGTHFLWQHTREPQSVSLKQWIEFINRIQRVYALI